MAAVSNDMLNNVKVSYNLSRKADFILHFRQHISNLSQPSPMEGPGWAPVSEYYRHQYKEFQSFSILHTVWNDLKECTINFSSKVDQTTVK